MKTLLNHRYLIHKYKKYLFQIGTIVLLIGCQIFPLLITPIIAPSTVVVQAANPLETLGDLLSLGKNTVRELQNAINIAGNEARVTLEKLNNDLTLLLDALEQTYHDNLNITLNSLDDATSKKLLEVEDLILSVNQELQADITLASEEAQAVINQASQEIKGLSSEVKQSLNEVIVVGGNTVAHLLDRSTYNLILVIALIFLGIGLLLFIWLLFSGQRPEGLIGTLAFFLISVYLASFSGLAFVPKFRGQVMAVTGVGLEQSLKKVQNKPRIFDVVPEVIVIGETKEIEIWGNSLLPDDQPPLATIANYDVPVVALSEERIVLNVEQLNAPEGSANLILKYDNQQKVLGVVSLALPYIAPPPADLVITNFKITPSKPRQRGNAQATITLANQGGSEAKDFKLEWKPLTNAPGKIISVGSLKAGESKPFSFNSAYSKVGTFETIAIADANNNVPESNEANNSIAQQITVRQAILRKAKVTVKFTKIFIDDNAEPVGNAEIQLDFNVNGKTGQWYKKNAHDRETYKINKTFSVVLQEKEKLKIFIDGIEKDAPRLALNNHESMGSVTREFISSREWGKGSHKSKSSCDDGCYTIYYTISVKWL